MKPKYSRDLDVKVSYCLVAQLVSANTIWNQRWKLNCVLELGNPILPVSLLS